LRDHRKSVAADQSGHSATPNQSLSPGGAQHLPEVAYDYASLVRVEVAANPAATKPNSRLSSAGSKRPKSTMPTEDQLFQQHRPFAPSHPRVRAAAIGARPVTPTNEGGGSS